MAAVWISHKCPIYNLKTLVYYSLKLSHGHLEQISKIKPLFKLIKNNVT